MTLLGCKGLLNSYGLSRSYNLGWLQKNKNMPFLSPPQKGYAVPKMKTNSGAKKRFTKLSSGKVKRKNSKRRHCLENKNHKTKRRLAKGAYVHSANMEQMARLLVF